MRDLSHRYRQQAQPVRNRARSPALTPFPPGASPWLIGRSSQLARLFHAVRPWRIGRGAALGLYEGRERPELRPLRRATVYARAICLQARRNRSAWLKATQAALANGPSIVV